MVGAPDSERSVSSRKLNRPLFSVPASVNVFRNDLLSRLTRDLEWIVHSMSRTEEGYGERLQMRVDAIKQLHDDVVWEDGDEGEYEDARDIVTMIRDTSRRWKGKARE